MRFLQPWWLVLLTAVAALALAYVLAQRRRGRYAVRFAALPLLERVTGRGPGWRRHVPAVAFGLVVLGLVVGLARPVLEVAVPRERATVVVALDVSTSMRATDVEPSRIDAATAAARAFVSGLPETFNVGLVTFSGAAAVAVAPTLDRTPVLAALQDPDLGDGTAIGDAVEAALDAVGSLDTALGTTAEGPPPARVVLLSDGANTAGTPIDAAAEAASAAGVPVSTIAYGTPAGVIDSGPRTLPVPVDPAALADLAAAAGGTAYTAATGAELQEVYQDIGSSVGYRTEEREVTGWVLAAALVAALAAAATSLRWFARLP
ncbi:VWA domain-containing protein [Pseudonocardia lacus]|uniref:VWA domain-containing protein n=1 Tax=Pseudonocardia lacus TaxID=2835865 RepID=UPI001BDBB3E1|nr:VWA domain-containing protein [Pseudonocardia lacus]